MTYANNDERGTLMKNKSELTVRIDEELLKKLEIAAEAEGMTVNNRILQMIRSNIAYYEKIHGKIKV